MGKTTCAAARAVAEGSRGTRVLAVSTDPAHSLGDALGVHLSSRPRQVRGSLAALELDAPRAFRRWMNRHRRALGDILEHGTWLDRTDIEDLLRLSMPGIDELISLIEITRLVGPFDQVVIDTAPTGHTLRLLGAPDVVAALARILDTLEEEHRTIRSRFGGVRRRPEAADRLIDMLADQARSAASTLRDPELCRFHWVTLPEPLSIAESADAIDALSRAGLAVGEIIVNRVLPSKTMCRVCDRRRLAEARALGAISRTLARNRSLRIVPAVTREPRSVLTLARLGRLLTGVPAPRRSRSGRSSRLRARRQRPIPQSETLLFSGPPPSRHLVALDDVPAIRGADLLFVAGKGGVGKTTVAAALAILVAGKTRRPVTLMSIDPAHSIGDVLGTRPIQNVEVLEVDARRAFEEKRELMQKAFDEIGHSIGTGDAGQAAGQLMDLAPPGIDELFGMLSIVDALGRARRGAMIVVDLAPTGHALRLLEVPDAALEWMHALMRLLLKYRELARPGRLAADLLDNSRSIRSLQATIRDPVRTRFIVVTRAAALPRVETERLLVRLRGLRLDVAAILVNARTLDPRRCHWCRRVAAHERHELEALRNTRAIGTCTILESPLTAPPPSGSKDLERWASTWTKDSSA